MAHDVFISYAHQNKAIADMVCAGAESRGVRCWMAPRDIAAGADWGGAIMAAIRASKLMVLVFSTSANESRHVPRELERAIDLSIPVIPFRIEDVAPGGALEYGLSSVHWFDAITPPIEDHVARLGDTLSGMLGRPVAPPAASLPAAAASQARPPLPAASAGTAVGPRFARRHAATLVIGVSVIALVAATYFYRASVRTAIGTHAAISGTPVTPGSVPSSTTSPRPEAATAPAPVTASPPAQPQQTEQSGAPARARSSQPAHAVARDPATAAKCRRLNESASVGNTLTAAETDFLRKECRD